MAWTIDPSIQPLVDVLNLVPGFRTSYSCGGHATRPLVNGQLDEHHFTVCGMIEPDSLDKMVWMAEAAHQYMCLCTSSQKYPYAAPVIRIRFGVSYGRNPVTQLLYVSLEGEGDPDIRVFCWLLRRALRRHGIPA